MSAGLIQAIMARFNASQGRDGLNGNPAPLETLIGEMYVNKHDSPPRIVWVPTADSFQAPTRIGTDQRALRSCSAGWDCAVWGPDVQSNPVDPVGDYEKTRLMRDALIVAIHQESRQRFGETSGQPQLYDLQGAEWLTAGQMTAVGLVCLLRLIFREPVLVEAPMLGKVETVTTTTTINDGERH